MTQIIRHLAVPLLAMAMLGAAGCQGNSKEREAKREHDRTMMRLQDGDRERTELKAQIDQLKANLDTAVNRSREAQKDMAAMQDQLRQAQQELSKSQNSAAGAAELQRKLTDMQATNEKLSSDIKSLQQQLAAAKAAAAKMTPPPTTTPVSPPSTQPTMNK